MGKELKNMKVTKEERTKAVSCYSPEIDDQGGCRGKGEEGEKWGRKRRTIKTKEDKEMENKGDLFDDWWVSGT